ncbi:25419_t:CDS:2 [Gigaspora margarita]|uniref:25419_t:CDS:1 n=1 Tax=Gigaspora margarita TaxID=4874 RepID=A0ABM8W1Q4_GIGMA|nr:25419_t:CDS:2 [Gigaspora margarita]
MLKEALVESLKSTNFFFGSQYLDTNNYEKLDKELDKKNIHKAINFINKVMHVKALSKAKEAH